MLSSYVLGFIDEIMTLSFNAKRIKQNGVLPPFRGKKVIFVDDLAQLPPVDGEPFYRQRSTVASSKQRLGLRARRSAQGHAIYRNI
jgi:hypothetical protein